MARQSESVSASSINLGRILCYNYWDSPEAAKLFEPKNGNTVLSCLSKRVTLLTKVSYNDNMLTHLLIDVADINNISSHQRQTIRQQCMYLRKAYEVAIQKMNSSTWSECVKIAIDELADCGIVSIKKHRTIQLLNLQFRKSERLFVPFL